MRTNEELKLWVETELKRQKQALKDLPSLESDYITNIAIFPCINLCEKLLRFIKDKEP